MDDMEDMAMTEWTDIPECVLNDLYKSLFVLFLVIKTI